MTVLAIITRSKQEFTKSLNYNSIIKLIVTHLLTSSADWAIKKPCVLVSMSMLVPGLIAMQLSVPLSDFASIAINNNFSFV